jgi:hypothetical protein
MRSRVPFFTQLATILVVLLMVSSAFAGSVRDKNTVLGVKAGLITSGTWYVGDFEYEADMSYLLGGFVDYKLGPKITGGAALNFGGFSAYEESSTQLDIGFTLKAMVFSETSNLTFRPGFGISYGMVGKMGPYESSEYLVLHGMIEMVIGTQSNMSYLAEIGLTGSPDGGNDDITMTTSPRLLIRGGIIF